MAEQIMVCFDTMDQVGDTLGRIVIKLNTISSELQAIKMSKASGAYLDLRANAVFLNSVSRKVGGFTVGSAVGEYAQGIATLGEYSRALLNRVNQASTKFSDCEKEIAAFGDSSDNKGGDENTKKEAPYAVRWEKLAKELIKSFGFIGATASFAATPLFNWLNGKGFGFDDDGDPIKELLSTGKSTASMLGKLAAWHNKEKNLLKLKNFDKDGSYYRETRLKNLLGLNKKSLSSWLGHSPSTAGNWANKFATNLKNGFSTQLRENFIKSNGNVNVAGISGVVLSTACSAWDNYNDYKEGKISGDRAVVETAAEVGANLVVQAGATALVTTTLAAAGVASAPVVVVAATSALVVYGADAVSEAVFGESVSKAVATGVGELWDAGKGVIKSLGEAFANKTKSFFSGRSVFPAWSF